MSAANEIGTGAASAATGMAVKSAPPVIVSGLQLFGVPLNEWVLIATLAWIGLQSAYFLWEKVIRPMRQQRKARRGRSKVFRDE